MCVWKSLSEPVCVTGIFRGHKMSMSLIMMIYHQRPEYPWGSSQVQKGWWPLIHSVPSQFFIYCFLHWTHHHQKPRIAVCLVLSYWSANIFWWELLLEVPRVHIFLCVTAPRRNINQLERSGKEVIIFSKSVTMTVFLLLLCQNDVLIRITRVLTELS